VGSIPAVRTFLGIEVNPIEYTVFDIGMHKYTKPSLSYLQKNYNYIKKNEDINVYV
jgi:hypothetical protein